MSFSAAWLALREPVDHRSVSVELRAAVARHFAGRDRIHLLDLGCGSGSNLRGLAPFLGPDQQWTLVDWSEELLAHARAALTDWADDARQDGETLLVVKGGRRISVDFMRADLARHAEHALDRSVDLVTAAAFFDLVSEDWIHAFCGALAVRKLPLYAVLTYDGRERWWPAHPADEAMLSAFHAHQRRDKGFGPAAGPDAADVLSRALVAQGFEVARAASPWITTRADASLVEELAAGAAGAVAETGLVPPEDVEAWLAARRVAHACEIGHLDVFAVPR